MSSKTFVVLFHMQFFLIIF